MPREPRKRIKVQITHLKDKYVWTVVVNELIDAMILDKAQFKNSIPNGSEYKIIESTDEPCTYGELGNVRFIPEVLKKSFSGNYVPYYEKMWRNF